MAKRSPVVAAIPNYNMGGNLRRLLPQLLAQPYDRIFVLDDASTDQSVEVVNEFGNEVKLLRNPQNGGAGATRNQIIDHVGDENIVHFIDADMDLQTADAPAVAREVFARYADRGVGMVGGLVSRLDGTQEPHNYGAVFSLLGSISSGFPWMIYSLRDKPRLARAVQRVIAPITKGWPNILEPPIPKPAYWVHEGNMLVNAGLFRSVGGYDPMLRSHEIQDLAIRLEKMGIKRQFDPAIKVVHHHIDVRGWNRHIWANKAALAIVHKHGLYRFLTER
ncbi:glycosyltransferase family 2 protein [Mycobacterium haemophilum]|uniref:Glycosyl transferase n=1 Tax=Mycobacterium haemophilum TaxID=29311 RepID=A0A0I9TSQ6_9MYCO|nr:glycosyltransferase family 2 protein [Mycobacterium haemophilum]KLO32796.1 glycosyl transferase [Mycobacterium haemophilum]KLO37098.1 glycosyl transferase [Mycobacterium haemophilum]KLO43571.1 glycosyl transferase [Mycobacterium haemophilum]KLO55929.1 glycosyl transferase [Mycobacterium haemophilum]